VARPEDYRQQPAYDAVEAATPDDGAGEVEQGSQR
jgi:hypothetical protein